MGLDASRWRVDRTEGEAASMRARALKAWWAVEEATSAEDWSFNDSGVGEHD